jgi:small subunit ribosomal protein S6
MQRRYEVVLVADPAIPEPTHDEHVTQVEKLIGDRGGVVHKVDRWGRMKLAYPIKGRTEGNYTLLLFDGEPEIEKELLRRLKLSDAFIRFLAVRADHEQPPTAEEIESLAEKRGEQLRKAAEREAELAAREAAGADDEDESKAAAGAVTDDDASDSAGEEEE